MRLGGARLAMLSLCLPLAACSAAAPAAAAPAGAAAPDPSAGCALAQIVHGRPIRRTLTVGGVERAFLLDVPEPIAARTPVPLLLDFHGFGHSAEGVWRVSGFRAVAAREHFIVAYPDGLPVHLLERDAPGWEIFTAAPNGDVNFTVQLLDTLEREYCIDRRRVYATGFSNGAFLSNLLACALPDRIAAVAPVSGGPFTTACTAARAVPVIIHHGRNDPLIPVARARNERDEWVRHDGCTAHDAVTGCERYAACRDGAVVEYCENDGVHTWPPEATERIWEFLQAHPLPLPATGATGDARSAPGGG